MAIYFTYWLIPTVLLALPIFWLVLRRDRWRLLFTLLISLTALGLLHPIWVVAAVGITVGTHQLSELLRRRKLAVAPAVLLAVAVAVVTLAIGKYGHDLARSLLHGNDWAASHLIMPLGISYFVFRVLQYVFDQARGVLQENSLFKLGTFLFFIPTVPAGPLETYQGFYEKRSTSFDRPLFYKGLRRIAWGYFKKVFVVDFAIPLVFGPLVLNAVGSSHWQGSAHKPLLAIFYAIVVFVKAYFDLSAYTDLAIGFSCLFGFRIMENFKPALPEAEPERLLAGLAHLALELVPQQRLLPGVWVDPPVPWLGLLRLHVDDGPLARRHAQLDVLGPLPRQWTRRVQPLEPVQEEVEEEAPQEQEEDPVRQGLRPARLPGDLPLRRLRLRLRLDDHLRSRPAHLHVVPRGAGDLAQAPHHVGGAPADGCRARR